jgi:hypothetical protein
MFHDLLVGGAFACPGWPPYTLRDMTAIVGVGVSDLLGRK